MDTYTFDAQNLEINIFVKLHNYFAGLAGRKDQLKTFCTKNGIDYKPQKRKYKLPAKFLVIHNELNYLSDIRDKSILKLYEIYAKKQVANQKYCRQKKEDINIQKSIIVSDKAKVQKTKRSLQHANNPLTRIKLQNDIRLLETKIQNEKSLQDKYTQDLTDHNNITKTNIENWKKQIDIVNNVFGIRKKQFEKNVTKSIRSYLNFTDFQSEFNDYGTSVKPLLKGDFHEEK